MGYGSRISACCASLAWLSWGALTLVGCSAIFPFTDLTEDTAERCSNRVDEDLDEQTDCEDPDCDGFCTESSAASCSNCRDDDGNGVADHADPICWSRASVTAGVVTGGETQRCSSRSASSVDLAPTEAPWDWGSGCEERGECGAEHPWEPDPTGSAVPVARLEGGETCLGAGVLSSGCDYALAPSATTGGVCWAIDAEILLGEIDTEIVLLVAPELSAPPLGGAASAAVVSIARRRDREGSPVVTLSYAADGRPPQRAALPDPSGWLRLRVESSAGDAACSTSAIGELAITLAPGDASGPGVVLDRWSDTRTALRAPVAWAADAPLELAIQAAGVGSAWVRALRMDRERFDPCGYPVPQITGDDSGPAVVLAAARGGGRICAVGATTSAPHEERGYDPRRHHGSPPELPPEALHARAFASWTAEDRGIESFGAGARIDGPIRARALDGLSVRAAELAWDDEIGFEGVLLVSEEPRSGGRLVRISSPDCARWEVEALDELAEAQAEPPHPLLYELSPRRLVMAVPAGAYAATDDTRCCNEPECPAIDQAACDADETGADWPATCFVASADAVPYIKPVKSECMQYPRGTLIEAVSSEGSEWSSSSLGALPALQRWVLGCGCGATFVELRQRGYPSEAHQLLERGGYRAFVVSGPSSLEIVVDEEPELGSDSGPPLADGALMQDPLLAPSRIQGTFDEARVAEGHVLMLGHASSNPACPLDALLFYRGFTEWSDAEDGVAWWGGAVGVIPVRLAPPIPDRQIRACYDLGLPACE